MFLFAYLTQLEYGKQDDNKAWRFHKLTYGFVALSAILFLAGVLLAGCSFINIDANDTA